MNRLLEITPALAADQIVYAIADALLVLDREGVIRIANDPAARLLDRPATALVGEPLGAAMGAPFGQDLIDAVAATGLVREPAMAYHARDGRSLSLDVTGCVTRDHAHRPLAFVFIFQDVTEYRQLQEQVYEGRKLDAMRRLAGDIARELETSVGLLSRRSAEVLGGLDRVAGTHHLRMALQDMDRAADRAAELIDQLLAFGSSQGLKPTLLDLNAVVTSLRGLLQWVVGPAIQMEIDLDPALGWVKTDPLRTEHVLVKLAANARDAMITGGTLTIETRNVTVPALHPHSHGIVPEGHYAMVTVGAPNWVIDKESQRHVFEPFVRPALGRGTGMELPAIYGIVKQSGGYIGVDGAPGRGSTFRIYFPVAEGQAAPAGLDARGGRLSA